jgi:ElaB/YqjD/DUF883 family membrane-anchored ribosome-binding protein
MDQQRGEGESGNTAAKVGDTVSGLAAQSQQTVRDAIDRGKPMLQDAQAKAGQAMEQATDLARKASTAGVQAAMQASDAVQGAAREIGSQARQTATTVYQQGARAGGFVSQYTTEQPIAALLIAAAIGYALAYLIHRP